MLSLSVESLIQDLTQLNKYYLPNADIKIPEVKKRAISATRLKEEV